MRKGIVNLIAIVVATLLVYIVYLALMIYKGQYSFNCDPFSYPGRGDL